MDLAALAALITYLLEDLLNRAIHIAGRLTLGQSFQSSQRFLLLHGLFLVCVIWVNERQPLGTVTHT